MYNNGYKEFGLTSQTVPTLQSRHIVQNLFIWHFPSFSEMRYILSLLILLINSISQGQIVNGVIVDDSNQETLEYVNIGILNQGVGTVSDEQGQFSIELSEAYSKDTIIISILGYESLIMRVSDFLQSHKDNSVILLTRATYNLKEITVQPFTKQKEVGNKKRSNNYIVSFENNKLGAEMGTLIKINKRKAKIENVIISVARCDYDSVIFRLNVYSRKNKLPNESLLNEPVYFTLYREHSGNDCIIDLSRQNLIVHDDIIATVECLSDMGKESVWFSATFLRGRIYMKEASHDAWETAPNKSLPIAFGIAITATIKY